MSGVFGFRHNGKNLLTFGKASAEEMDIGLKACIAKFTTRAMQQAAGRIEMVDGPKKTTEAQRLEVGRKYEGTTGGFTWHSLLWQTTTMASIRPWVKDGLIYMVDASVFAEDPWCGYRFVVDIDALNLEMRVYQGLSWRVDFSNIRGRR